MEKHSVDSAVVIVYMVSFYKFFLYVTVYYVFLYFCASYYMKHFTDWTMRKVWVSVNMAGSSFRLRNFLKLSTIITSVYTDSLNIRRCLFLNGIMTDISGVFEDFSNTHCRLKSFRGFSEIYMPSFKFSSFEWTVVQWNVY